MSLTAFTVSLAITCETDLLSLILGALFSVLDCSARTWTAAADVAEVLLPFPGSAYLGCDLVAEAAIDAVAEAGLAEVADVVLLSLF